MFSSKLASKNYLPQLSAGAAVLGIVGAAGLFFIQQYRQEKLRNAMTKDLARLDKELSKLRSELQHLQHERHARPSRPRKSVKSARKANSVISSTTDEYLSASNLDSSDLEFYDLSDDESENANNSSNLDTLFEEIDTKLSKGSIEEIEDVLQKLEDLCIEYPENPDLLYRIGRAHYKLIEKDEDKDYRKHRISKGIEACEAALNVAPNNVNVHKYYAILIGCRSEYQSIQNRISDGKLFKKHIDLAITLDPNDEVLHFLCGKFAYEVAGLKWYERKAASALFGEPPNATYEDAFNHFLNAEKVGNFEWMENRLMIAKCKIALDHYEEAIEWLERAKNGRCTTVLDNSVASEVDQLLNKYNKYR